MPSVPVLDKLFALAFVFILLGKDVNMLYIMAVVFGLGNAIGTVIPPLVTSEIFGNQKYISIDSIIEGDYSNAAFLDALNYLDNKVNVLGLKEDVSYRFSKWDPNNREKYMGTDEEWDHSQGVLKGILDSLGIVVCDTNDKANEITNAIIIISIIHSSLFGISMIDKKSAK